MNIHCIESGPLYTNCYIVVDDAAKRAIIIDAPRDCADAVAEIVYRDGLTIERVLLTHSHWDHTADAALLKKQFHVPVAVHKSDEDRMLRPGDSIIPPPFVLEPLMPDEYIEPDQTITIGSLRARVLFTPGHTEGSVCFLFEQEGTLFSGDTLFAGSVGRTDLPGGSWETLVSSLRTVLLPLPDHIRIFPGHGPVTIMRDERMMNPFLNGELAG